MADAQVVLDNTQATQADVDAAVTALAEAVDALVKAPQPTPTPEPTDKPEPTQAPEPTDKPEPTQAPNPTDNPSEVGNPQTGDNANLTPVVVVLVVAAVALVVLVVVARKRKRSWTFGGESQSSSPLHQCEWHPICWAVWYAAKQVGCLFCQKEKNAAGTWIPAAFFRSKPGGYPYTW